MKTKELRELSPIELDARLRETREKLFQAKFRHRSSPLKNPLEIRNLRRDIARILTIMNQHKRSEVEDKK
jgi:large subunit ribosomal protein L29